MKWSVCIVLPHMLHQLHPVLMFLITNTAGVPLPSILTNFRNLEFGRPPSSFL